MESLYEPIIDITKVKYITTNIKVKSYKLDENQKPLSLTTTKDIEYYFPIPINLNSMTQRQLINFLTSGKSVSVVLKGMNIHKVENLAFYWHDKLPQYKLMVITWTTGLIFNDDINVLYIENVYKFFKSYDVFYKTYTEGTEIIVILKDMLPISIPIKY